MSHDRALALAFKCLLAAVTPALADVTAAPIASAPAGVQEVGLKVSGKSLISILQPHRHVLYDMFTNTFISQGRFDYVPIGYRNDTRLPSASEFLSTFRTYLKDNAGMITSKDVKPDFKFGDVVISGADLDKFVKSAYVMLPRWSYSPVMLGKETIQEEKDGTKEYALDATSGLSLSNEIIHAESGLVLAEVGGFWPVSKRISVKIGPDMGRDERKRAMRRYEFDQQMALQLPPEQVMADHSLTAAGMVMNQVMTLVRRLDAFRLHTYLADDKNSGLKMVLGQTSGVVYDSAFDVYRKTKSGDKLELQPAGFLKVRNMDPDYSTFQTIQDTVGFEAGDQLIEHPQTGLDGTLRLGMIAYDPLGGMWLNPALTLATEANLAPLLKSAAFSETYLTAETSLVMPYALEGLLGLKKRIYSHQMIYSFGLKGGFISAATSVGTTPSGLRSNGGTLITKGSNINVVAIGLGLGPTLGLEYQFNPDLKVGVDAGFMLFGPVTPSQVRIQDQADSSRTYDFGISQLPSGLTLRDGNANGLTLGVTGSYSF